MAVKGVYGAPGGTLIRAQARRVQLVLLGYFAYCITTAVVVWTVVRGAFATPVWIVLAVGPVLAYASRRSLNELLEPVISVGRDDIVSYLGPLEHAGYTVVHDVDLGRMRVDHLVIGPSGVYAIERSARTGRFTLKGAKLTCSGLSAQRLVTRATDAADVVARRLAMAGVDAPITPVLALTRSEHTVGTIALRRVSVVRADDRAAWINRRPVKLETLALDRVRSALV
jgi:hypothetical protein